MHHSCIRSSCCLRMAYTPVLAQRPVGLTHPSMCLQPTAESSSGSAGPATVEDLQRVFKAFAMFGTGAMVASPAGSRQRVGDLRCFAKQAAEKSLRLFVTLTEWGDHNVTPATCQQILSCPICVPRSLHCLGLLRWFCLACPLTVCIGNFGADHQLGPFF